MVAVLNSKSGKRSRGAVSRQNVKCKALTPLCVELLSPAGNWSGVKAAVVAGADSVYFGVKNLTMRNRAGNFAPAQIAKVMEYLHANKTKGYLAVNTLMMTGDLKRLDIVLRKARKAGVDAVIVSDMAAFEAARAMGLNVHISTQAGVSNVKALEFYAKQGAKRVILARECTLVDIKRIVRSAKKANINCEVEVFAHGAMCLSVSGRCFMSKYTHGQSANRGECTQPCRREYSIKDTTGEAEFVVGSDYVLSPKDLCTIDFIDELIRTGVNSIKIEGRMRTSEYVSVVTSVYREAISSVAKGRMNAALKKRLKERLKTVFNRGFSTGFYFGEPQDVKSSGIERTTEKIYLGDVRKYYQKIKVAEIFIRKGVLKKGGTILISGKTTPAQYVTIGEMQQDKKSVKRAGRGESIGIKVPAVVRANDKVYLWKNVSLKKEGAFCE